jgi:hypothetical protein
MKRIFKIHGATKDNGYASFVITLITIILVGLIVLGFSIDANIEQKNSLGNILSTAAYYAAESGINDAYNIVSSYINKGIPVPPGDKCNSPNYVSGKSNYLVPSPNSSGPPQIYYSCLMVNPEPQTLQYQDLLPGTGTVIPIESYLSSSSSNPPLNTITISWEYHISPGNQINLFFSGCPNQVKSANFPSLTSYPGPISCGAGVLQVDLASSLDINTATTVFLEPQDSPAVNNTEPLSFDRVIYVNCSQNSPAGGIYACTTTINVSSMNTNTIYLHLIPFYDSADVSISATAQEGSNINPVSLQGAQVLIDSTGYASGQYKRLQERVCDNLYCGNSNYVPASAIQSDTSICKNFVVYPGNPLTTPSC